MSKINLLLHIFSCFFLCGLIWTIQVVHYPGFIYSKGLFLDFHSFHSQRITWVVGPIMLLELLTGAWLLAQNSSSTFEWWNLASIIAIWLSTALISVPYHTELSANFSEITVQKLVITNWIRTALWTLRSGAWLYILSGRI